MGKLAPSLTSQEKKAKQGIEFATLRSVGTALGYATEIIKGKPGVLEGNDITVNPDNVHIGRRFVTMSLDIANIAVPDTTGKSENAAKNLTEEADMETLIRRSQEMQRKGNPAWKS